MQGSDGERSFSWRGFFGIDGVVAPRGMERPLILMLLCFPGEGMGLDVLINGVGKEAERDRLIAFASTLTRWWPCWMLFGHSVLL